VVLPSGDPTLSERFYPRAEAPLDSIAQALWDDGLRQVEGSLVLEVSAWDSTTVPGSWMVGNLTSSSGATPAPLGIEEGVIVLEVSAAATAGAPARTRWWPETHQDFFSASFVTVHPDSTLRRVTDWAPESRRLLISGRIPAGQVDTLYVAQRDPLGVASGALLGALERRGIRIEGGLQVNWHRGRTFQPESHPGAILFHTLWSPSLLDIVEAILEPSQNWMTEQLVHALGRELGDEGSWQGGFEVQRTFLAEEVGVDTLDLHFRDGSGLSAYNLVTPRALVTLLDFMRRSPQGQAYRQALAEPGEEEGTLRNRLEGLEGRVFAKTGTISHVNSLSGYLVTDGGRELIFSILTNGSGLSSSMVRRGIDGVVRTIASLGG
jgi:D-alanyl-D-alanine carboxypeptidase/D-alanyl-D-alanine-endopeptidase (penicillin-binding protein 4)